MIEPALHVKVTIDGEVVKDETVSLTNAGLLSAEHVQLCADAERAGKTWLVEVTDHEGDIQPLRFGTDTAKMNKPIPIDLASLPTEADELGKRRTDDR